MRSRPARPSSARQRWCGNRIRRPRLWPASRRAPCRRCVARWTTPQPPEACAPTECPKPPKPPREVSPPPEELDPPDDEAEPLLKKLERVDQDPPEPEPP